MRKSFISAAVLVSLAACHKAPDAPMAPLPPPPMDVVLPNVPIPPQGVALSQESGVDATQITFVTPIGPDSILKHYRHVLADAPFRLVSEEMDKANNSTIFMAEQDGPMVWVTVKSDGSTGTAVTIAGGATLPKSKPDSVPKKNGI